MKYYFTTLFIVYSTFFFSQEKEGRIVYSITINADKELMEVDSKYGLVAKAIEATKTLEFFLDFNEDYSKFYRTENINIDSQSAYIASTFCSTYDVVFSNLKEKYILAEKNAMSALTGEKNEYIRIEIIKDWEVTNESKTIDGFICYKAFGTKVNSYLKDSYKEKVVAWFCPSLPYAIGPSQYNGLPGLILELQEKKVIIGVKRIDLVKKIDIKIDNKKSIISKEEYDKLEKIKMDKVFENAKANSKSK